MRDDGDDIEWDDIEWGETSGRHHGEDASGSIGDADVTRWLDALDDALRAGNPRADGRSVASSSAAYVITRR